MLQPRTRWLIQEAEDEAAETLARELGIDRLLARLLVVRGIRNVDAADRFLHTDKGEFNDPYLLDGMDHAVRRIREALSRSEKIRIYGDYDADGVSSTALMIGLMRRLEADFDFYIPHRVHEGYGLNRSALEHAKKSGVSLIVTVDTGISAREEIAYATELGLDVVVTDHHEPPELLPDACAVINPKKPGCSYPFKQLAGVGVAFKLAHALLGEPPLELLEYAVIGTVADLMPLLDENRLLVREGLKRMREAPSIGIKALLGVAGIDSRELQATHIGFALGPRINASGRLDAAGDAVKLLTTANEQEAEHLAFALDSLNKERQRIVEDIAREAHELAAVETDRRVLVLAKEEWNVGVIGIVASKMMDRYYCPTVVLSIDPQTGLAKGSARSIAGFDLHKALSQCSELFEHFGGHQAAAGMTLHRERIPELRSRLLELAAEWLRDEDYVPIIQADACCSLADVPLEAIRRLDMLAPFGMGNPTPRFVFKGLQIAEIRTMGKEQQHIKLSLSEAAAQTAASIEAVGFGKGGWSEQLSPTASVDVVGELSINEWNGVRRPQLVVHDLCVPQPQLFDWRGAADYDKRWLKRLERFVPETRPALIVFSEQEAGQLPQTLRKGDGAEVWRFDEHHGFVPLLGGAQTGQALDAKDILFPTLPPSLDTLEQALNQLTSSERIYARFQTRDSVQSSIPPRDSFKTAYAALRQLGTLDAGNASMLDAFSKRSGLSVAGVTFMFEVFEELEFIVREGNVYRCITTPAKRDLSSSSAYQARLARQQAERLLIYSSATELCGWIIPRIGGRVQTNGG